jgi:alkane 1-monooxygenase
MIRYAGPVILLATVPLFYYAIAPGASIATVGILLAVLIGAEFVSARGQVPFIDAKSSDYRSLLHAYIPLQLSVTAWAIGVASHTSALDAASLALAVGVTTGVFGMLAAHEMIHSKSPFERKLGLVMLSGMSYRHFRIAHVHGHHRWAGTERNSATALSGESFYAFFPRTVAGQFKEAYLFERMRYRVHQFSFFANRVVQDIVSMMFLIGVVGYFAGAAGLIFFIAQSAVAILVVEMFSYIAHYGLVRRKIGEGRWERLDDRHSWNSSNVAANLMIFNMGRHAYHHRKPAASYESLKIMPEAPELPAGYAASILLALVPPLWRRIMDPPSGRPATNLAVE